MICRRKGAGVADAWIETSMALDGGSIRLHRRRSASSHQHCMTHFKERLRNLELHLIGPGIDRSSRIECPTVETIHRFRCSVYSEFGSMPRSDGDASRADEGAWHLVATRASHLLGCIRFHIFHPHEAEGLAARAIANSRCIFSAVDRERCEIAIARYGRRWRASDRPLVQAGGLAVEAEARGTPVAPALCLAGNALVQSIGATAGIVFAGKKSGSTRLYARSGCTPLQLSDEPLGDLFDRFHDDRITVMGMEPHRRLESHLDSVVVQLGCELAGEFARLEAQA